MGYKNFPAFQKLASADVNEYLMKQSVMSFADAAERDTQLTAPQAGMCVYLAATKQFLTYNGTGWGDTSARFYSINANFSPTVSTSAQPLLAASGSSISLDAGITYEIDLNFRMSWTNGGTATTANFLLGLTSGTLTSSIVDMVAWRSPSSFVTASSGVQTTSAAVGTSLPIITQTGATSFHVIKVKAIVRTSAASVLTPQLSFSQTSGVTSVTVYADAAMRVMPVGLGTLNGWTN